MRLSRLALVSAVALLVAACSSTGSAASPTAPAVDTTAPSSGAMRIDVKLGDGLRIEPTTMMVKAGQPVTFVVTNVGSTNHEFFLGDDAAQMTHDGEMMGMAGMTHDEAMGIGVMPGETKELTVTFPAAGTMLAGCHVNGHYAAGMKATIAVTP